MVALRVCWRCDAALGTNVRTRVLLNLRGAVPISGAHRTRQPCTRVWQGRSASGCPSQGCARAAELAHLPYCGTRGRLGCMLMLSCNMHCVWLGIPQVCCLDS